MKTKTLIIIKLLGLLFNDQATCTRYISIVEKMRVRSGLPFTIKYMKAVKLHITRYLSGKPMMTNSSLVALHEGFPTKFFFLKSLIDSKSKMKIRLVLSLLTYTRSIKPTKKESLLVKADFSSISNPYKGKKYTIPLPFIKEFVKNYRLSFNPVWDEDLHYISNKSSPQGKSTMTGPFAIFQMTHFYPQMIEIFSLLLGEQKFAKMIGNYANIMLRDHRSFFTGNSLNGIGKISVVHDPELKERAIAMIDYYSQILLKPIHDEMLKKLKNFTQDRTFTQDPINNWGKAMGNRFWSLDLSSATDRFPISLQEKLLGVMINDTTKASLWKQILIDRDYKLPNGSLTRYSVGQPMGAYSSWTAFTLTHHLVVAWAAYLCNHKDFKDYILLGDDIVIRNDKIAQKYITVMTRLGVDISMSKTHVSKNTYEFAKRWIHHGVEISGLPLRGLVSNWGNLPVVIKQLVDYTSRVPTLMKGTVVDLIVSAYSGVKMNGRYISTRHLYNIVSDTVFVVRFSSKLATYQEIRNYLLNKIPIDELLIPNKDQIHGFIRGILCLGLTRMAERSGNDLSGYYNKFISNFRKGDFDTKLLKYHPIVLGLFNKTISMKKNLQRLRFMDEFDLIDAMTHMRVDTPDKIVSLFRSTSKEVVYLDRLWKTAFQRISIITEDNYLNFREIIEPFEKDGLKPWESYYIQSLGELTDKLEAIKASDLSEYRESHNLDLPTPPAFTQMW
jgi:hypothetical protein